jgi:uncharacterized protein (TIGR02285 family)
MQKVNDVIIAALLCGWISGARAAEQVTWISVSQAPASIAEGPLAGQGTDEVAGRLFSRILTDFDWTLEVARPLRIRHEIEHRDGVCSNGLVRLPERETIMAFSARAMAVPGYGMILRADRLPDFQRYLDSSGAIDLDLLRGAPLTGGYVAARPLFQTLKTFIDSAPEHPALVSTPDTVSLFRQLDGGRVDFLFGLRDETAYFAGQATIRSKLISLPIAGTDRYGFAYIACSNGPIGRHVIASIDAYLADDRHWSDFVSPWRRWLSPEDYAAALKTQTNPVR